jgi:hypothetical protein
MVRLCVVMVFAILGRKAETRLCDHLYNNLFFFEGVVTGFCCCFVALGSRLLGKCSYCLSHSTSGTGF